MRQERWWKKLASNSLSIKWDLDEYRKRVSEIPDKALQDLATETERFSMIAQNHARTNAPWTDRTGNARQGLFAQAFSSDGGFEIVLYHTMFYGVFLERRWDGRWGIIPDTVARVSKVYTAAMTQRLAQILKGS
jgi:hypothetical protein